MMAVIPYSLLERVRLELSDLRGEILDQEFAAEVTITVRLRDPMVNRFTSYLENLSSGKVGMAVIEHHSDTIMPILPENATS